MFRRLHDEAASLTLILDGAPMRVPAGETVAAAILGSGNPVCRQTPVSGADRAPFCLIGACFDCLVEIDGVPDRQACMVAVQDGMTVRRQPRPAPVAP
jgi:predicted molibdopterin-dependent oxidoreductase YjgC